MIQMPWDDKTVPHLILEVNNVCNISCRGCYKKRLGWQKTLPELDKELDAALTLRKVHTVSITGGEPTLHPDLPGIVKLIKSKNLKSALVTNGLLVNKSLLEKLKSAGLDLALYHVDEGQARPDLPDNSEASLEALRARLVKCAAECGLNAGLAITVYPEYHGRVARLMEYFISAPDITYALVTNYMDIERLVASVRSGCKGVESAQKEPSLRSKVVEILLKNWNIEAFNYLRSQADRGKDLRGSLSYFLPIVYLRNGEKYIFPVRSNWLDRLLVLLPRLVSGRFIFYCRPDSPIVVAQVLFNALSTCRPGEGVKFLVKLFSKGAVLRGKRMMFDNGPSLGPQGGIECCVECPSATLKNGRLVRVCLSDHIDAAS